MVRAAKVKKEGFIDLEMVVTREGNQYSSWCPLLDIASCGDSPDEAVKNLCDAVGCYLEALKEDGTPAGKIKTLIGSTIAIVSADQ